MKSVFKYIVCFMLLVVQIVYAAESDTINQTNIEIQDLSKKINNLKERVFEAKDKRVVLNQELKAQDLQINHLNQDISRLNKKIITYKQELKSIQKKLSNLNKKSISEKEVLSSQLISFYKMGDYNYWKLILSQEDVLSISKLTTYFKYINEARIKSIRDIKQTSTEIGKVQSLKKTNLSTLNKLVKTRYQKKSKLVVSQNYQLEIIKKLNQDITSNSLKIKDYEINKGQLTALLNQLKSQSKFGKNYNLSFKKMMHKLNWPTQGKIKNIYGKNILNSNFIYNGITIVAPEGQAVNVVYGGKVVFANWLKGFGLLIIVDHGHGYMTLYAHNQALYHKVGDWVKTGDLIATVGHSGGTTYNGVYFEVRYNGKPLDPANWLTKVA